MFVLRHRRHVGYPGSKGSAQEPLEPGYMLDDINKGFCLHVCNANIIQHGEWLHAHHLY